MKTTDLFKSNRSAKKINESMEKMFGTKLDLASFDLPKLEDARNKIRTQLSQVRANSGFNENVENEAVTQAQWMLDAINSEIAERQEFIADPHQATVEGAMDELHADLNDKFNELAPQIEKHEDKEGAEHLYNELASIAKAHGAEREFRSMCDTARNSAHMDYDTNPGGFENWFWYLPLGDDDHSADDEGGETDDNYAMASAGFGSDEDYGSFPESVTTEGSAHGYNLVKWYDKWGDQIKLTKWIKKEAGLPKDADVYFDDADLVYGDETIIPNALVNPKLKLNDLVTATIKASGSKSQPFVKMHGDSYRRVPEPGASNDPHRDDRSQTESAPPTDKGERMVKHIKKGYAKDGKLTDKEKGIAYATAWKQHNKEKNESIESGEDMTTLREGEVQQASAIVTAKTMVDRVSRWIEELSGMENDTLLQLGDSIRDEMSAEQAKSFISQCAPAIQQALQNLKDTRETLSTGVRMLTGEEQGAEMLGGEPGAEAGMGGDEFGGEAEPDMMNAGGDELGDMGGAEDEFGAADAAAGGLETAGREQRESIDRSNSLLRVLAG